MSSRRPQNTFPSPTSTRRAGNPYRFKLAHIPSNITIMITHPRPWTLSNRGNVYGILLFLYKNEHFNKLKPGPIKILIFFIFLDDVKWVKKAMHTFFAKIDSLRDYAHFISYIIKF